MLNTEKKYGVIAGVSLIIMTIIAGFSYGYAHPTLITNTTEPTIQNLLANKSLFGAELTGWSLILLIDVVVSIALYFYFYPISKQISFITAAIRIVYTLVFGGAIVKLFKVLPLTNEHLHSANILSYFQQFEMLWSIGLIVFGFHLMGLGYLSLKSKSVPWWLAYLLYLGGVSYTFIHAAKQFSLMGIESIQTMESILAIPMTLAEVLLAIWLIYSGFRKFNPKNAT